MPEYILGIDIGTSSCKASVFDKSGHVVASQTGFYQTYYPMEGYVEQKPKEWWETVCRSVRDVIALEQIEPADIKAVGVDGQSWSAIIMDRAGEVLFDNPIWMDTRAQKICQEINSDIGENSIFEICGNPFMPAYTTPKLIWFKRNYNDVFKKAYKVLQANSYIVYQLTGCFSQDLSQCYGLHFFDMQKCTWDRDMARSMDVDVDLMPEIMDCHQIAGSITREASSATGLCEGTPVVAGGLDAACGTLGAGVINRGQTQEQGGQAGGMSICLDSYKAHKKLIMSHHVVPNRWLLQGGTVGGGGTLKWLQESFFTDLSFADMSSMASQVTPGAEGLVFLPYLAGERSPIWDANAKGVFYGLDYTKNKSHLIRAVMEGVAFSLLHNIETAEDADAFIKDMHAVGGAADSETWMQIKADVTGKTIAKPSSSTATTLGAAMLAGIAVGIYSDFADAVRETVRIEKVYQPNLENHNVYHKQYKLYLSLYENLKESMEGL